MNPKTACRHQNKEISPFTCQNFGLVGGATSTGGGAAASSVTSASASVTSRTAGQAGMGGQAAAGADEQLQGNAHLSERAQGMLPPGSSVQSAAAGFQNQTDFFAAIKASQNLKVPFDQIKANVKGSGSASLEAAIRKARPDLSKADVKTNAQLAQTQAVQEVAAARVEDQLSANAGLAARAKGMLPAGTDMSAAVYGFQNAHDFVMAEHISQNMHIPLDRLQASVAGQEHAQFQTAVAHLRPDLDGAAIKSGMKTAGEDTNADFKASGRSSVNVQAGGGHEQATAGAGAQAEAGAK